MHTIHATKWGGLQQKAQFTRSKVENLFRHRGGNYYAVAKVDGKVRRRSLETADFNQAKGRLSDALADLHGTVNARLGSSAQRRGRALGSSIKETTRHYYEQIASSLIATSDGMDRLTHLDQKREPPTLNDFGRILEEILS